jgi:hypothetical protein
VSGPKKRAGGQTVTDAPKKTLVMAGKLQARTTGTKAQDAKAPIAKAPAVTLPDTPAAKREDAKEKILRALKRLHPME